MGTFSEYGETKLLGHITGQASYTAPTTYLALVTTVPTSTTTAGSSLAEATYTGYARLATASGWGAPTLAAPSTIFNSTALTFAACSSGSNVITGFALCDASTVGAGNVLMWASCASTTISTTQTPPTFATNAIEVTLS